jgi:hypothetical protein
VLSLLSLCGADLSLFLLLTSSYANKRRRCASHTGYGAQPRTKLNFGARPASAPATTSYKPIRASYQPAASYKPAALGGYSYGTAKYGGTVGASGAARATNTYTSALASRPVASTLASSSTANADDLLAKLREQRAQREARWSRSGGAAASTTATTYTSKYTASASLASSSSTYTHKPSAHVLQLKKATDRLAASPRGLAPSPRVHMRSELAAAGGGGRKTGALGSVPEGGAVARGAAGATAARPQVRTSKYYRETDYGVGFSRGYGRTASTQLGVLSPTVSERACSALPPPSPPPALAPYCAGLANRND